MPTAETIFPEKTETRPTKAAQPGSTNPPVDEADSPEALGIPAVEMIFPENTETPPVRATQPESVGTPTPSDVQNAYYREQFMRNLKYKGMKALVALVLFFVIIPFGLWCISLMEDYGTETSASTEARRSYAIPDLDKRKKQAQDALQRAESRMKSDGSEALTAALSAWKQYPSDEAGAAVKKYREKELRSYERLSENTVAYYFAPDYLEHNNGNFFAIPYIGLPTSNNKAPFMSLKLGMLNKEAFHPVRFTLSDEESTFTIEIQSGMLESKTEGDFISESVDIAMDESNRKQWQTLSARSDIHLTGYSADGQTRDTVLTRDQVQDIYDIDHLMDTLLPMDDFERTTKNLPDDKKKAQADIKFTLAESKLQSDPRGALRDALAAQKLYPTDNKGLFIKECRSILIDGYDFEKVQQQNGTYLNPREYRAHNTGSTVVSSYIVLPWDSSEAPRCVFYFGMVSTQKIRPESIRLSSDDMTYEFHIDPAQVKTGTTADGNQSASVELLLDENAVHKIPFILSSPSFRMEVYAGGQEIVTLTQEQKEDMLMVMDCYEGLMGK